MPTPRPSPDWLDRKVASLPPSPTLAMNELAMAVAASGQRIFRLGFGRSPFPVPDPVVEALRQNAHQGDYLPVRGLPALRAAAAEHASRHAGVAYDAEQVLIGPGSKELMFLVQIALQAELLIPSPAWVSYAPQATVAGRRVTWLPTRREDRWQLEPDLLRASLRGAGNRPRLLLLNYPNNPNGATMAPERLKAIGAIARAHGLLVLADEIYGLVDHAGTHVSMASVYPEGTLVSTGLSKWCGAGGWRLGTMLLPRELAWLGDTLATLAGETYSCVSAPIQHAAVVAFRGGPAIDLYLRHVRRILGALGRHVASALSARGFLVDAPDGGFYVFPDAAPFAGSLASTRSVTTAALLCDRLLEETGVAVLPGSAFGRPPEELTFRLSYVDFDGRSALRASQERPDGPLDRTWLRAHCPQVLEGVTRLTSWVGEPVALRV